MSEPGVLLTIPSTVASHVLGKSSVVLGEGDLTVMLPNDVEGEKKPELMLTVGTAGFLLHKDTAFGTLADDPRAYVFSPEIEGVHGGYVQLRLPEQVTDEHSLLAELQTKFEEILIRHGLLQAGTDEQSSHPDVREMVDFMKPVVKIPATIAIRVLGESATILGGGDLSLVLSSAATPDAVLNLTVGKATFPLLKSTILGTLADDPRAYIFIPENNGENGGYVKIVLPAGVTEPDSPLSELQSQFEQVLINHGLLKEGIAAAADELGMSVREDPAHAAHRIRDATALYLSENPRTDAPSSFSQTTHAITSTTAGTKTLATAAHRISGAVGAAAASAGAWVAGTLVPTNPDATQSLVSAEQAHGSVADGVRAETTGRRDAPECVWAGGE